MTFSALTVCSTHSGRDTAQKNRAAAREEAAEPMHLRTGMIKRRDAEEHVRMRLRMMLLLGLGGGHKRTVRMSIAFGKPVVPDEKYIAASSSSVISTAGATDEQYEVITEYSSA